jgi:hypothetical protein
MYGICSECNKTFVDQFTFVDHECTQKSMKGDKKDRLDRLLASGGCSQEYYDKEITSCQNSKIG